MNTLAPTQTMPLAEPLADYIAACRAALDAADAEAERAEAENRQREVDEIAAAWQRFYIDVRAGLPPILLTAFEQLYGQATIVPDSEPSWLQYLTLQLPDCTRIRLRFEFQRERQRYEMANQVDYETFEIVDNGYFDGADNPLQKVRFDRYYTASSLDEAIGYAARWHLKRAEMEAAVEQHNTQARAEAVRRAEVAKVAQRAPLEEQDKVDSRSIQATERESLFAALPDDPVLTAVLKLVVALQRQQAGYAEQIEALNDSLYAQSEHYEHRLAETRQEAASARREISDAQGQIADLESSKADLDRKLKTARRPW